MEMVAVILDVQHKYPWMEEMYKYPGLQPGANVVVKPYEHYKDTYYAQDMMNTGRNGGWLVNKDSIEILCPL